MVATLEQQQQQQQQQHATTIYSVTDGLGSPHTKKNYRKTFSYFLKHVRFTEQDLISQARANPRQVESLVISYIRYLSEEKGQARGTIKIVAFSIFHFLEMNDITFLNKKKILRFLPPDEGRREDRAYTHEEIAQILEQCDERSRVIILLMASTGMRRGAIPALQIDDLTSIDKYPLYKIIIYASSGPKDRYYSFCTPECRKAIDSYLAYRERFGERLKPSSPLIREEFNIRDPFRIASPKAMGEDRVANIIKEVLKKSLGSGHIPSVKQSHGFRKFAITQMIKAKVDFDAAEYLVGHKSSRGIRVHYDRTTEEDRLSEYLKALDLLTINPENRLKIKIRQMESEHSAEWNQLKAEMSELKDLLSQKV